MTGLGVAEPEDASVATAVAEAVSLGAPEEVEPAASLAACWPPAASSPVRPAARGGSKRIQVPLGAPIVGDGVYMY